MATQLNMPQMGYDMEEGTVIRWLVEEGADVAIGDAVAEIETDKAAVDFESPVAGVLLKVLVAEGTTVPVGETIAIVGDAGEDLTAVDSDSEDEAEPAGAPDDSVADAPAAEPAAQGGPEPQAAEPQQERTAMFEDNFRASPVARKLAEEQGIDLSLIKGTGPEAGSRETMSCPSLQSRTNRSRRWLKRPPPRRRPPSLRPRWLRKRLRLKSPPSLRPRWLRKRPRLKSPPSLRPRWLRKRPRLRRPPRLRPR